MKLVVLVILASLITGCGNKAVVGDPTHATGEGIAKSEVLAEQAQHNVEKAIPHTNKTGKVHLGSADEQLTELRNELATVRGEQATVRQAFADANETIRVEREARRKIEGRWYYVWGTRIDRAFAWIVGGIVGSFVIGIVLRILAQIVPGAAGGLFAGISTAIFGVLSFGVSLVQSLFDNWYFRVAKPKHDAIGGGNGSGD